MAKNFLSYNKAILKRMEDSMPHYPRIRHLREDKDMTQIQMGKILSCSQRVYSNYERGDIDIPTAILIKLADFHNVSIDFLLGRTENPHTNK